MDRASKVFGYTKSPKQVALDDWNLLLTGSLAAQMTLPNILYQSALSRYLADKNGKNAL